MSYFDYNDPIITRRRIGDADDPYVDISEALTIDNNSKVVLTEIPDRVAKVQVSGQSITWIERKSGAPGPNEYVVDYTNKIVTFHDSRIGMQLQFTYKGTGLIYVPTSMIYTKAEEGNVIETLGEIIEAGQSAIEDLQELVEVVNDAKEATQQANDAAEAANTAAENADAKASLADTAATNANNAANSATNAANSANDAATYANNQGDYAKDQGDYAKSVGDNLTWKDSFDIDTAYKKGNIVYYNGSTYMCIQDSTGNLPTNPTYFAKITGFRWMGEYSASTPYDYGDTVHDSQKLNVYQSIKDNNLNNPLSDTSSWQVLVSVNDLVESVNTAIENTENVIDSANQAISDAGLATSEALDAASEAQNAGEYATLQGDYAKNQGDYAKSVGENLTDNLTWKGFFNISTEYKKGNIIDYNGTTYICIQDSTGNLPTNSTYFAKMIGFRWMGEYSASTPYDYGDTVHDSQKVNIYRSIQNNNINNALSDTSYWELVISVEDVINNAVQATNDAIDATNDAITATNNANQAAQNVQDVADSYAYLGEYNPSTAYKVNNQVTYNGTTWICIQDSTGNTPDVSSPYWRIFATGGEVKLTNYKNTVTLESDESEVTIGIPEYNKLTDLLVVYVNSTYIEETDDYTISNDGLSISKVSGTWVSGSVFNFVVYKNVPAGGDTFDGSLILDGTVTNEKLDNDIKIGSLAELTTIDKDSVVDAINEIDSNIDSHIAATTSVHGSTSSSTPNTIVQRDANGRFKAAAPVESDDVARKAETDAALSAAQAAAAVADAALPKSGGTMTGGLVMSEWVELQGKDSGGNLRRIAVTASDVMRLGDPNMRLRLHSKDAPVLNDSQQLITSAGGQMVNNDFKVIGSGFPQMLVETTNPSNAAEFIGLANGVRQGILQFWDDRVTLAKYNSDASAYETYIDLTSSSMVVNGVLEFAGGVKIVFGTGSPEGVVTAPVGSLYSRTDGGASTTLYVKESGTGNTGWKAVQTA